ncbi:hypothetical protein ACMA5I_10950 [Paracoccaceae bacterium GXU_MW_L88]
MQQFAIIASVAALCAFAHPSYAEEARYYQSDLAECGNNKVRFIVRFTDGDAPTIGVQGFEIQRTGGKDFKFKDSLPGALPEGIGPDEKLRLQYLVSTDLPRDFPSKCN